MPPSVRSSVTSDSELNICAFTPPYYTTQRALDDERFARLKNIDVVDEIHHLYRGSVQPNSKISDIFHWQMTDSRYRLSVFRHLVSATRSCVNQHDIDLLYCFDYRLLPPVSVAATLTRRPLVFEYGSRWEQTFDRPLDRFTWIPLLKLIFRSDVVEEVIALADHLNRSVQRLGAADPITVYPLTNKEPFLACDTAVSFPEKHVILYVGRISPEKGPQRLLDRFDEIQREDVGLHFVGDNINDIGDRTSLARQIQNRAESSEHIHYHGWVEYADLPPFYRGADLVALPSLTEGFPAVIPEALATETPVVCSDIPAFKEIVKEEFGRISDADSMAFTNAMIALIDDDELRQTMGAAGREFVLNGAEENRQLLSSILGRYA